MEAINPNLLHSTERSLEVLNLFSEEKPELSLTEISALLNVSKQVTLKSLNTLKKHGFLRRNELTKKYSLGYQLIKLGNLAQQTVDIKSIAHPFILNLAEEISESVYLVVPDLDFYQAIAIDWAITPQTITSKFKIVAPLYAGSSKKVILAYLGEKYVNSMFENIPITSLAKNTVLNKDTLLKQLEIVRGQGYCITKQETDNDTAGIAAPIFNSKGIAGSIGVYIPMYRFTNDKEHSIIDKLLQSAQEISKALGYHSR